MRSFASDNNSGAHPLVMEALVNANPGYAKAYGEDELTLKAESLFREMFVNHARTYFVTTGTAANVVGLRAVCKPHESIYCNEMSHVNTDECGAAEAVGLKIMTCQGDDGKIRLDELRHHLTYKGFVHRMQPRVISITQCTEMGVLYTLDEIRAICDFAHQHDMIVHMDGARFSNACAALDCTPAEMTVELGVDLLSFGATKNGLLMGEAIVILNPEIGVDTAFVRKQEMQLVSKMRYIGAQFIPYINDGLWLKNAQHANSMAQLLAKLVGEIPGVEITDKVQCNAVFAKLPKAAVDTLMEKYYFYVWDEMTMQVRWMTSWATTVEQINEFVADIRAAVE